MQLNNLHPFRQKANLEHFYIITVISNPVRYESRYRLYKDFREIVESGGAKLITVEQIFGDRNAVVTERDNPFHVQVFSVEELWHKENLIDIGVAHMMQLDPQCKKFMWCDADIYPTVPSRHWFEEVVHQLDHNEAVQCFNYFQSDEKEKPGQANRSFVATYIDNGYKVPKQRVDKENTQTVIEIVPGLNDYDYGGQTKWNSPGRTGGSLAWNVDAYNKVGGMIDYCILGSGDWYMALGLVGEIESRHAEAKNLHPYSKKLLHWQELAERWIKRDVGYVNVNVGHFFHGSHVDRQYSSRGNILIENNYDPNIDIKYDSQGLIQLETWELRQIKLRDQIRSYFRGRREDN